MTWFRGKTYKARVHLSSDDFGCVPLDSIQTDDLYELEAFVSRNRIRGFAVEVEPGWADSNISVLSNVTGA
jgi:hypothetical protein